MSRSPIVSHCPGRLRLRSASLRLARENERTSAELRGWEGVTSTEGNPRAGSILVLYDPVRLPPKEMERRLAEGLAALFGSDAVPLQTAEEGKASPAGAPSNSMSKALWRLNRPAKIGMLASLTGSLVALAAGKKLHAVLGVMHLAFLSVHLANHRKKLVR